MAEKLTLKIIKERLIIINPNIEILSKEYINNKADLLCKCKFDNYEWITSWNRLKKGEGCPQCRKFTIEKINKRLLTINPNIEILSNKYVNARAKLKIRCKIDNCIFNASWEELLKGKMCPQCVGSMKLIGIKEKLKTINENIEILSDVYIDNTTKLGLRCKVDGHLWQGLWRYLLQGHGCTECMSRNMSGKNSRNWKGGISNLAEHLRCHILLWKKDSMKNCNYKCTITGEKFDVIHHLYNFSDILQETMDTLCLPIYQEINKYTDIELKLIDAKCLELHYKYGLGVCLTNEEHNLFHSIYSKHNNTPQQYDEFRKMRLLSTIVK